MTDTTALATATPGTLEGEKMTPPETRVGSTADILQRIGELKKDDTTRSSSRAQIQGIIDGNRPYRQSMLDAKGMGEKTNLNLREAEGMADAAKTPYFTLVFRAQRLINIQLCYGDPNRRAEWSEKISNRIHDLLSQWRGHTTQAQLRDWQMCVFGIGHAVFEHPLDWRWTARKISEVLVPDKAEADIDKLSECAIPRRNGICPVDLYKLVKNEKSAKTMGWYPENVKKAIVNHAPESVKNRSGWGDQWGENYQASLRRGDISWNDRSSNVPIADYFHKEFDGKITHCIVVDDGGDGPVGQMKADVENDERLLYRKIGKYESFDRFLHPFFFDVGTGEWHSIKGLGPKIHDFCDVSNRLTGRMVDAARRTAGPLLKAASANSLQEIAFAELDGATAIHPDFSVEEFRMGDSLNSLLGVKRDMQNTMQSNVGQYRQRVSAENQEPTLGQAQLNQQTQSQLGGAAMDRHLETLDRLYTEQVRRIFDPKLKESDPGGKEALQCIEKMIEEDEIPEELLKFEHIRRVNAGRSVGNGSPQMMIMISEMLLKLLPMVNERGRNVILRNYATAVSNQAMTDQIVPRFDEAGIPDDHVWAATMENYILRTPGMTPPPTTPMQDDVIHAQVHIADAFADMKALGQRQPEEILAHLYNVGPHVKAHLDKMAGDETRKGPFQELQAQWLVMGKAADKLQQQVEMAAQAAQAQKAQEQPPQDPAIVKALGELAIKRDMEAEKLDIRRQTEVGKLTLKQMSEEGKLAIKADSHAAGTHLKDLQTAEEIARTRAKDMAGVSEQ